MPTKKKKALNKQIEEVQVSDARLENPIPAVTAAQRFDIGREHILNKYWELANLDPEATKGTITGQLKALDSLCEELGMANAAQRSDENGGRQEIYRSAWMRPPVRDTPAGSA